MNRLFEHYGPYKGTIEGRQNGVLISNAAGETARLCARAARGARRPVRRPGEQVYEGMIIGENAKPDDLEVNPMKAKQLTNFRVSGKDDTHPPDPAASG